MDSRRGTSTGATRAEEADEILANLHKGEEPAFQNAIGLNLTYRSLCAQDSPVLHLFSVRAVTADEMVSCKVEKWVGKAATLDLKSKEEKDAELDKRIEALRRKNEALIRRYQVP
ncbi:coiled-coil domain containing 9 [Cricetulus griseus]